MTQQARGTQRQVFLFDPDIAPTYGRTETCYLERGQSFCAPDHKRGLSIIGGAGIGTFTLLAKVLVLVLALSFNCYALEASWYSRASLVKEGTWKDGIERKMANGQIFDDNRLTCACRLYPLGSLLRITNLSNGKSVNVLVTDRIGKRFAKTRIDLSRKAFSLLADTKQGLIKIKVEVI